MHEVQRNVPIPKVSKKAPPVRRKYPLDTMDVGEMFFIPGKTKNTLVTHTSAVGKKLNRKFTTRLTYMVETLEGWKHAEPDTPGAVLGIGVWRTR